jgi:hypothetical protein
MRSQIARDLPTFRGAEIIVGPTEFEPFPESICHRPWRCWCRGRGWSRWLRLRLRRCWHDGQLLWLRWNLTFANFAVAVDTDAAATRAARTVTLAVARRTGGSIVLFVVVRLVVRLVVRQTVVDDGTLEGPQGGQELSIKADFIPVLRLGPKM